MLHRHTRGRQQLPLAYDHGRTDAFTYSYSKTYKPKKRRSLLFRSVLMFGGAVSLIFMYWLSSPIIKAFRTTRTPDHESEQYFNLADGTSMSKFPSVFEPASLTLSVVVPAYNEEERMPQGVDEMISYLKEREKQPYCPPFAAAGASARKAAPTPACQPFTWEVIIVNDGSKDATASVAMGYVRREGTDRVRLLNLYRNSGKGAAVRKGAMRARGQFVLMADADGATRFSDVSALMSEVGTIVTPNGEGVAIGSRAHAGGDGSGSGSGGVKRSPLRRLLMWGFHTYMTLMVGGSGIRDTQCGFKLFTRPSARKLFDVLHIERWAFDVELVYLASRMGMPMVEVPVTWHEVSGSKVDLVKDSMKMARDILVIRTCYMTGVWSDQPPSLAASAPATAQYSFEVWYPSPSPAPVPPSPIPSPAPAVQAAPPVPVPAPAPPAAAPPAAAGGAAAPPPPAPAAVPAPAAPVAAAAPIVASPSEAPVPALPPAGASVVEQALPPPPAVAPAAQAQPAAAPPAAAPPVVPPPAAPAQPPAQAAVSNSIAEAPAAAAAVAAPVAAPAAVAPAAPAAAVAPPTPTPAAVAPPAAAASLVAAGGAPAQAAPAAAPPVQEQRQQQQQPLVPPPAPAVPGVAPPAPAAAAAAEAPHAPAPAVDDPSAAAAAAAAAVEAAAVQPAAAPDAAGEEQGRDSL